MGRETHQTHLDHLSWITVQLPAIKLVAYLGPSDHSGEGEGQGDSPSVISSKLVAL